MDCFCGWCGVALSVLFISGTLLIFAAGSVGCWQLTPEFFPRICPPLKGATLLTVVLLPPTPNAAYIQLLVYTETQRPTPMVPIWDISEGTLQLRHFLWDWVRALLHHIVAQIVSPPISLFFTPSQILFPEYFTINSLYEKSDLKKVSWGVPPKRVGARRGLSCGL